jgi:serine/threonine protein kinase
LSSARYIVPSVTSTKAEEEWLRDEEISKIEPLVQAPDYLSITWLASKTRVYGERHIPSSGIKGTFYVGQGATFVVYRTRERSNGISYVIKRPIISFGADTDEEHTLRQLYSLHLELRVLTDKRIRSHDNIVKLETVIWEEHPDDLGRYWPSLVMEYAKLGTLSSLYDCGWHPLNFEEERRLCHAMGAALRFLHENGVVHGDVKPENVLMFGDDSSTEKVIPKLADFGYALLDGENTSVLPLGTFPWAAPEVGDQNVKRAGLLHADAYSFGLLVWFVSRVGRNPFQSPEVCESPLDSNEAKRVIRELKRSNGLLNIAIKSLQSEKKLYMNVFENTLELKPEARDLEKALEYISPELVVGEKTDVKTAKIISRRTNANDVSVTCLC